MTIITSKSDGIDVISAADMNAILNKIQTTNATNLDWSVNYAHVFNAKRYGAAGDGTTDDSSAIQASINAANSAGRGIAYLPPQSVYAIAAGITLSSGVIMSAFGSKIKTSVDQAVTMKNRSRIFGLSITASAPIATKGIFSSATNVEIGWCEVDGGANRIPWGIDVDAAGVVNIHDNYIHDCYGAGIFVRGTTTKILVQRNTVKDCIADPSFGNEFIGISPSSVPDGALDHIIVSDNILWATANPGRSRPLILVAAEGGSPATAKSIQVSRNAFHIASTVSTNISSSIYIHGLSAADRSVSGVTVSDNILIADGYMYSGITMTACQKFIVSGNIIQSPADIGIWASAAVDGIICSNNIYRNPSSSAGIIGIYLNSTSSGVISANLVDGFQTGIYSDGTSDWNHVFGNRLKAYGTIGMNLASGTNNRIKNNMGHLTENSGDASVSNGTTIAHGLASTPGKVVLTSQSALARIMSVTARGATNFTVGVLSTTGTAVNNTRAYWYAEV